MANEELRASNEELLAFSENLDLMVRQKSAQLQAYVDAIDVSIYSTVNDFDGKFVKVNEQVTATLGYTKNELLGSHYSRLSSGNQPEDFFVQLGKVVMGGRVWRGDVEYKTKNGALLWFDCIVIPIRDSDSVIKHFLTLGLPITEKKQHQKLQEETLGLLEGIAFRASHRIRGPLARVKGLSDLVRKSMIDKNEFIEIAEKMAICSEELNEATSELVNYVYDHHEALTIRR